ncbi:ParB/RepB/Spo0J family partition protein [Nitrosovibrio sp. Nv6]|uniref:ParB/RepB/Spo0J family partition protein n=1 Tax=Nitrosovibrio sp. Nv6 TaxID=1855340 RepID=UPI0008B1A6AF|nr:ParB/RepB/Spo0J family partition protein [Nitrosovibrio sp. Nv6]SEP43355.1 ParB/RepB/Spo0J family partition protein [Nitrosovibrio sp. Nv6]
MSNLMKNIASISDLMAASSGPQITILECHLIECRVQVRTEFNDETIKELADDIMARGVQQPIKVRPIDDGRYLVIFGERRLRAAGLAGLATIPAIIEDMTDSTASEIQFMENIHREDLSTADLAAAIGKRYKQLKTQDVSNAVDVIAGQVKKSKSWVSKHLAIATKLNSVVAELMQHGHTQDVELLLILNKLVEAKPSEGLDMVHAIRAGENITRKDAREALKNTEQDKPAVESDSDGEAATKQKAVNQNEPAEKSKTKPVEQTTPAAHPYQFDPAEALSALEHEENIDVDEFLTNLETQDHTKLDELVFPHWQLGVEAREQGKDEVIQRVFLQAMKLQEQEGCLALRALLAGSMGEPFDLAAIIYSTREIIGLD